MQIGKLKDWYYSSWLGGKHLELLLWLDSRKSSQNYYLNPLDAQQIIREYSLLNEGVKEMKFNINGILKSRTKEEYHEALTHIENLMDFAQRDENSPQGKFAALLRQTYVRKNSNGQEQDVLTATDRAKMIQKKIDGIYELQEHVVQRNMLRQIRKLRETGNNVEADTLFAEWKLKYGKGKK